MRTILAAGAALLLASPAHGASAGSTFLVDRPTGVGPLPFDGINSTQLGDSRTVSADGRYVVFDSSSDALLPPGASRSGRHIFVRDRTADTTTPVDTTAGGVLGNGSAFTATISADGTAVVFRSNATNLTADPVAGPKIYLKDLTDGSVELVSRATGVAGAPDNGSLSDVAVDGTGTRVAFVTSTALDAVGDTNAASDVYVRDIATDTTTLISRANGANGAVGATSASNPAISANGLSVAFDTTNQLDPVNDTNTDFDVYVRAGTTTGLVSFNATDTAAGNGDSRDPSVSNDGFFIAFSSDASNLVANDTNTRDDVFVRDLGLGTTSLVSRPNGSASALASGDSFEAALTDPGARVAFSSTAPDLLAVPIPTAVAPRGYLRTIAGNQTVLVTRADGASGVPATGSDLSPSADGQTVVFNSQDPLLGGTGPDAPQIFARDVTGNTTEVLGIPSGTAVPQAATSGSESPNGKGISGDGRFVVFESGSDGLSAADDDTAPGNIFIRDTSTDTTTLVSTGPNGPGNGRSFSPRISDNGAKVAFTTGATNLGGPPGVYVWDRLSGTLELASRATGANGAATADTPLDPSISADGSKVSFQTSSALDAVNDTNNTDDIYVRDLVAKTTVLASRGVGGAAGNASAFSGDLSADGNRLAWATAATDLGDGDNNATVDVHVRDLAAGTTVLVSRANGAAGALGNSGSELPAISADGTKVAFVSTATNLDDGDTTPISDVHVRDLGAQTTTLVSREGANGAPGTSGSTSPAFSGDGTRLAFVTDAPNLLPAGVTTEQVLVRTLATGATEVGSRADGAAGAPAGADARGASLDADGGCLVFTTRATGLEPGGYPSPDFNHVHVRVLSGTCGDPLPVATPTATPTASASATATPTPTVAPDRTAPVISRVRLKRKRLGYRLSEAARVRIDIARKVKGKGFKRIARLVVSGRAGANVVRFKRKVVRRFRKGRYRAALVATDAAGNAGRQVRGKLRVRR